MSQSFVAGDFLVFQLEAGYGLLRVLAFEEGIWHIAAYDELFPAVEAAEAAATDPSALTTALPHVALTNRAFESTQVAKIANTSLTADEAAPLEAWRNDPAREISDRSIRLLLGLR